MGRNRTIKARLQELDREIESAQRLREGRYMEQELLELHRLMSADKRAAKLARALYEYFDATSLVLILRECVRQELTTMPRIELE